VYKGLGHGGERTRKATRWRRGGSWRESKKRIGVRENVERGDATVTKKGTSSLRGVEDYKTTYQEPKRGNGGGERELKREMDRQSRSLREATAR